MADSTPRSYHTDPQLYLYTSLTSGSSQIVTATSRLQTILKANRIDFQALDVATDEKARMLWGRRAGKRKLPGLVRYGMILGDLEQVEEWNEYGEIRENLTDVKPSTSASTPSASTQNTPSKAPPARAPPVMTGLASKAPQPPTGTTPKTSDSPGPEALEGSIAATSLADAMRQVGFEAAKKSGDAKMKARNNILEAAKSRNPDLQKLDNSGPTGMPPPTGTATSSEAQKPETGDVEVESKADNVPETGKPDDVGSTEGAPATTMYDIRAQEAEEDAARNNGSSLPQQGKLGAKAPDTPENHESDIPSSTEAQFKANEAIAQDEEEVLGRTDQPKQQGEEEVKEVEVPTAKEIEAKANSSIIDDKSTHVQFRGRGSVPHALLPPSKKRQQEDEEGDGGHGSGAEEAAVAAEVADAGDDADAHHMKVEESLGGGIEEATVAADVADAAEAAGVDQKAQEKVEGDLIDKDGVPLKNQDRGTKEAAVAAEVADAAEAAEVYGKGQEEMEEESVGKDEVALKNQGEGTKEAAVAAEVADAAEAAEVDGKGQEKVEGDLIAKDGVALKNQDRGTKEAAVAAEVADAAEAAEVYGKGQEKMEEGSVAKDEVAPQDETKGDEEKAETIGKQKNDDGGVISETAKRQEEKVGLRTDTHEPQEVVANSHKKPNEKGYPPQKRGTEIAKRQEEKVGAVAASDEPKQEEAVEEGKTVEGVGKAGEEKATMESVTGIPQALPGSKMQEQAAGVGENAGDSVED